MNSKFLLILGPSGVGKTSVIKELIKLDKRFVYISPFMTRELREGEKDKIPISEAEMKNMQARGEFLVVNKIYGTSYATPRQPIFYALENEMFPVLDWPIEYLETMQKEFPNRLYLVYLAPPSIKVLEQRLNKDGRDPDGKRLKMASEELKTYNSQKYNKVFDLKLVSEENQTEKIAYNIYINYLQAVNK